jgi:hypothetical protein
MPRTKLVVKEEVKEPKVVFAVAHFKTDEIQPITQEFGNGDMNVLRDKINEIIKAGK